jgi:hypothetical protein
MIAVLLFGISLILALVAQNDFLVNYENFISLLLYVLVPWTAVNLVDYYFVQHGNYAVDDFFRADGGRYGRVNWVAIASYVLGIIVQVPFIVTTLYTGPVGSALHGVDLSWIVGLVVVTPVYYVGAKWFRSARVQVDRAAGLRELPQVRAGPVDLVAAGDLAGVRVREDVDGQLSLRAEPQARAAVPWPGTSPDR